MLAHRYDGAALSRRPDHLIVEEPLEIHLDGVLVATTMRTPGHDFELAAGFCFTEGLLDGAPVRQCKYCGTGSAIESEFNAVTVDTGGRAPTPVPRLTPTTSACGMCGTTVVDDLRERLHPLPAHPVFALDVLAALPDRLAGGQELFGVTGGVHAAVAFDRAGDPVLGREDIGRHNAVDKVFGSRVLGGLPTDLSVLCVSGRIGFELAQKAVAAGVDVIAAVGAPSSLAVQLAERAGLCTVGFLREDRFVVYTEPGRIGV